MNFLKFPFVAFFDLKFIQFLISFFEYMKKYKASCARWFMNIDGPRLALVGYWLLVTDIGLTLAYIWFDSLKITQWKWFSN